MTALYIACGILYLISLIANPKKTWLAAKSGIKMLLKILPQFMVIILVMTFVLYIFPPEKIVELLSRSSNWVNVFVASIIGSIVVIPGFIVFPLAGILKNIGVGFAVLASFTTTLMLVGVLTYPLEKQYYGTKLAVVRNIVSYLIAIAISIVIGLLMGGLF
jgi:uncharacterized membrane protein YraQ (UPF0718 family)